MWIFQLSGTFYYYCFRWTCLASQGQRELGVLMVACLWKLKQKKKTAFVQVKNQCFQGKESILLPDPDRRTEDWWECNESWEEKEEKDGGQKHGGVNESRGRSDLHLRTWGETKSKEKYEQTKSIGKNEGEKKGFIAISLEQIVLE